MAEENNDTLQNTEKSGGDNNGNESGNADTTIKTTESKNATNETATGDTNTSSGNEENGNANSGNNQKRIQFSVRTLPANKEYFDAILGKLKQADPNSTADDCLSFIFEMARQAAEIPTLTDEISRLRHLPPTEKLVEKEVVKEIPIKLENNQALISFDPAMVDMIRKCRPYLKKKSILEWTNDSEFISKLTSAAIRKFLVYHLDNVVNPL